MKSLSLFSAAALSLMLVQGAYAQTDDDESEDRDERTPQLEEIYEEVMVTGSRIRRDEYTSAAPIQVIDGATSRDLGLIDTSALLQSTSQATGTQIDSTFSGYVLDNGPGSAQVNLRGLGATRSLLLLNSKRVAPGGVGGAPTSPDLSTIPNIMIDRIEFLLDGASSVYGSDAVAGVVNVLMRKDFEGFEFEAQAQAPDSGAGGEQIVGLMFGGSGDNWTFGMAGEFYNRGTILLSDRDYTEQCNRYIYETPDGDILNERIDLTPGTSSSPCRLRTINRVYIPNVFGNVWYTPGKTNIGIENFSETEITNVNLARFNSTLNPFDIDGDGEPDTLIVDPDGNNQTEVDLHSTFYNYNGSEHDRSGDFLSGSTRYNFYAYGDWDLQNESNTQLYFETLYSRRESESYSPGASIFPDVPANNPYNPCNQDQPKGSNCVGFFGGFNFGNYEVTPIVIIRGDRDLNDVVINQLRYVAGIRGDIPGLRGDGGGFGNWSYDIYGSYSTSNGTNELSGILEEELLHSLEHSTLGADGQVVCNEPLENGKACVPVNLFADTIYRDGGGAFATQAETDYLFGIRSFDTTVDQTIVSAVLNGDIGLLPWNDIPVPLVLGVEWRKDAIESIPNDVARDGLLFGFFKDGGATGDRTISEVFLETEFLLLTDLPGAREWSLNLATRYTDESTYGANYTYSGKMIYTPHDVITLRGTYGTSTRAPNAREQFLVGQSGFNTIFDPCVVPAAAQQAADTPGAPPTYDADNETRSQTTLDNCVANNVDPTSFGLADDEPLPNYSAEILRRGGQTVRLTIDPEESTSYTYGIVLDWPFEDDATLRFSATQYDIEVNDSIALLNSQFIINDCYVESENNSSAFCRFIKRDTEGNNAIDEIDSSFVNINVITSKGIDYNVFYERNFIINDRNLNLQLDVRITRVLENLFVFRESEEDDANTPVVPEYEGSIRLSTGYRNVRATWRTNYISGEADADDPWGVYTPCRYRNVVCRPVVGTDPYFNHSLTFNYSHRGWQLGFGVINIFDEDPPLMDNDAPELQSNNIFLGAGYDLLGRRMYGSIRKSF